jgi:hypothetical protein
MSCQVKTSDQCQLRDKKNTNIFHLLHCQQPQSLLNTWYILYYINTIACCERVAEQERPSITIPSEISRRDPSLVIQGVSEIGALILTGNRTHQKEHLFSLPF